MAAKVEINIVAHDRTQGVLERVGGALGNILTTAAGFVAAQVFTRAADAVVGFARDSISAASDLRETLSKTYEIFGEQFGENLVMWAERSATAVGLSQTAALDAASMFGVFGKAAGLAGDELVKFSEDNLTLAADLASFFNTSVEDATVAMQAAFRGETEPIRRYGVLLDDASLRQEALALGIISTTKDALTPQQKILAANSLLWKQTADAQGDFTRTSQGYANQQRIFNAQLENAKAQLGQAFLPILTKVMQFLNTVGIPALQGFIAWLQSLPEALRSGGGALEQFRPLLDFLGNWWAINSPAIIGAAQRIGAALVGAFEQAKAYILPFINEVLAKVVVWLAENSPLIQAYVQKIADVFAAVAPVVTSALGIILPLLGGIIDLVLGLARVVMQVATGDWTGAWATIRGVVTSVNEAINKAVLGLFDTIAIAFGTRWQAIAAQWQSNWNQAVEIVAKINGIIKAKVNDFVETGKQLLAGIVRGFVDGVSGAIESVRNAIGNIVDAARRAAGIQSPSRVFAQIGNYMMQGLAQGLQDGVSVPVQAVVGNTRTLAGAAMGAGSGGGGGVNVTVNYSTMLSTANEAEINARLIPVIIRGVQEARAQGKV